MKATVVYFIRAGESGPIKIGYAGDPARRMADLQVGCPIKLQMIGCIAGGKHEEKLLHQKLAPYKTVGEWFSPEREVLAAIDAALESGERVRIAPRRPKHENPAAEIISLLGGNIAVAELTSSKPSAVSNWRRFGKFPANTFVIFRDELAKRGLPAPGHLWRMVAA